MGGAGGPALKVYNKHVNKLTSNYRMVCQFIYMLATKVWKKKLFTHLMEIYLLFLNKAESLSKQNWEEYMLNLKK